MRPDDQAAVVVFGENALVERAPSPEQGLGRLTSAPTVARTNIQNAVQLGLAMLPADTQKRIVLLSDGGENAGQSLEAARVAQARGVPISFVDLSSVSSGEALLASLTAPGNVRQGQQAELVATVESNVAQGARLRIFGGDKVLLEQDVQLQEGENRFSLPINAEGQGFQQYRAQIEPQVDGRAQNNQAETLVRVDGPPRILLVEGQDGEAESFKNALAAAEVTAEIVKPEAMPADLAGLSDYEAVVLMNVPVSALPVKTVADLPAYVRELGKGLIMVGGDKSYGVGGYGKTPIEETLPVYMDVRDREERPDLGLVFIIDKSGSMDSCHCSGPNRQTAQFRRGGTPKVDIAKDAVIQASALLRPNDTMGVVAFDGSSHWVVPVAQGPDTSAIQSSLAPVAPEGGTNVRAGLQAAEEALANTDARIKHAILLTDGWSGGGDNLEIARRMREQGITLSVVAAGSGSADYLEQLAKDGGGRYYPAEDMEEVPQIFVQETITAVGNYLIEEPFTPSYGAPSPVLDGLTEGLPPLYGYNGTTIKETASPVLLGVDNAPVLAQWQYGLGRSIAWTSDAKGKWAKDWLGWGGFPQFAAQMVNWVLPTGSATGVDAEFTTQGSQTVINVEAQDDAGRPRDNLQMSATVVGSDGTSQQAPLVQVAPGQYRASIASPTQGTYITQIVGTQDGRVVVQDTAGMVVPYSPEYRQGQSNPQLLQELANLTGGARLDQPAQAFEESLNRVTSAQEIALPLLLLALLLLPFDIAVRRLVLRRSDIGDTFNLLRRRRSAAVTPQGGAIADLQRAKARATQRHTPVAPNPPSSVDEASGQPPQQQESAPSNVPSWNAPEPPASKKAGDEELLNRLLAAKDRARRRARGDGG
jgi:Mg-chelatase subunit ChlD